MTTRSIPFIRLSRGAWLLALLLLPLLGWGQTYYQLASGNYSETFDDISTWTNIASSGRGVDYFSSVGVQNTGSVPSATKTTTSTAAFSTGSAKGVQIGSAAINFLATGNDLAESDAIDLNLNFANTTAGNLSFTYAEVNNGSGDKVGNLKVYYSTNGTSFTELSTAAVAVTNNVASSGTISVALPTALNNSPTVKLRFYNYGTGGTTGSRAKIAVDNIGVTATLNAGVIGTGAITTPSLCVGASGAAVSVPFAKASGFSAPYTAYISSNNFSTKTAIGTGSTSPISATVPSSLASGTAYRIRVEGTGVATPTYMDNGSDLAVVNYQTNEVSAYSPTASNQQVALSWTKPTSCLTRTVIVASTASITAVPSGTPTASTTYGSGTNLGGNQYVVYSGTGSNVTVTGLTNGTTYYFKAFTTNGDGYSAGTEVSAAPVAPVITVTPNSLSGFATPVNTQSAAQTYTLTTANLAGTSGVVITAPTGYLVGQGTLTSTSTSIYAATITVTQANAVTGRKIYVVLASTATAGAYSGVISNAATGAVTQNVSVSGTVASFAAAPVSLTSFATPPGTASSSQSYTLTGAGLPSDGSIRVVASDAAYEVSTDNVSFSAATSAAPFIIPYVGTSATITVHVRLTGATAGSYNSKSIVNTVLDNANTVTTIAATVTVSGVVAAPTLSVSSTSLTGLGAGVSPVTKSVRSYSITAANLNAPVTITAPAGFEVATVRSGPYSSSLIVPAGDANGAFIYVRMTGAALGSASGTITNVSSTVSASVSVSGTVYDVFETFEGGATSPTYISPAAPVSLLTGTWTFSEAGISNSGGDKPIDSYSARVKGPASSAAAPGYIDFAVPQGVASISFYASYFGTNTTNANANFTLSYSANGGPYVVAATNSTALPSQFNTLYTYALNVAGPVNIRISSTAGTSALILQLDNIGIVLPTLKATPTTLNIATAPGQTATATYVLTATGLPASAPIAISSNNALVPVTTDGGTTYATSPATAPTASASGTLTQMVGVQYVAPTVAGPGTSTVTATIANTTGALSAPVSVTFTVAANEYVWTGSTSTSWSEPTNWAPARTTAAAGDILTFNGTQTPMPTVAVDFATTQTVGTLRLLNNANVTFSNGDGVSRTLTINNVLTGNDLVIPTGSTLTLTNSGTAAAGLSLQLGSGATASISGHVVFDAPSGGSGTHRLLGSGSTNSIDFGAGAVFTAAANFSGNAFGNILALRNNVIFRNDARYERIGGSNPFALSQPDAVVSFEPTSYYYFAPLSSVAAALSGRTYGTFEYNLTGTSTTTGAGSLATIQGNLIVTNGTININFDGGLNLQGDLLVNGGVLNLTPANGYTVQLNGTTPQSIGGTGGTLNFGANATLQINNATGVTLNRPLTVAGPLQLTSGLLNTSVVNSLTLNETTAVLGGSSTSFVNGPVRRPIGPVSSLTSFVFPVGKGTAYRPVTLRITTQTNAVTYQAEQIEGNPGQSGTTPGANDGTTLTRVSQVRSFTITPYNGSIVTQPTGFQGRVTLSFGADDLVTDAVSLQIAKRADSTQPWTNAGLSGGGISGTSGGFQSGFVTSGTITSFSDFALGSTNPNTTSNPLPVTLVRFTARREARQAAVTLSWATASEKNNAYFVVERSLTGSSFESVAQLAAHGGAQPMAYTSVDATAPATLLYYRLRQVDIDGTVAYSPVVTVAATGATSTLGLYPNPAHDMLYFMAPAAGSLRVFNSLGQTLRTGTAGAGAAKLSIEGLAAGTYYLELRTSNGPVVQKFTKE